MDDNSLSWPSEDRIDTISKVLKSFSLEDLLESREPVGHIEERMKLYKAQRYIDAVLQEIICEARSFDRKKFKKMLLKNTPICVLSQSSLIKIRKATEITTEAYNNLQQNNVYPTNHIINEAYPVTHIRESLQTNNPYVSRDLMKHLVDLKDMIIDIATELKLDRSQDFYSTLADKNHISDKTENKLEDHFIVQNEIPKRKKIGKFKRLRKKVTNSFKIKRKSVTAMLEESASKIINNSSRNETSPTLFPRKKTNAYSERNADKILALEREIIIDDNERNKYSKKYSAKEVSIESMQMKVNNYVQEVQQENHFKTTSSTTQGVKQNVLLESMNIPIYRKKVESGYNKDDVIINYQFTKFDKIGKPTTSIGNFQVLTVDVAQSLPSEKSVQVITISSFDLLSIQPEI